MSFTDNATELLARTESALNSLIADALKAKAYREITTLAAMAEALAAITPVSSRDVRRPDVEGRRADVAVTAGAPDAPKASEPSWMRPKV